MPPRMRYFLPAAAVMMLLAALLVYDAGRATRAQDRPTVTPNINWVREPNGINVRGGPGLDYNILGVLPAGSWVQPLARDAQGDWILIAYLNTQGWVQIEGVTWRLNTVALPVIDDPVPSPIPAPLFYNTPGSPTITPNANWISAAVAGVFVRSGPGQGYLPLGELFTGDVVDPVAHDEALDWVLIRFGEGYGWIRYDMAVWHDSIEALPVIDVPNLTPSFTPLPTATSTATPSNTPTLTSTATLTWTPSPTATPTATETATGTLTPTPTLTLTTTHTPTHTATASATASATATTTETPSATVTATPTLTLSPTVTYTATATTTLTVTLLPTEADTPTPTSTFTPMATATVAGESAPLMPLPTATRQPPSATASHTSTATATPAGTPTSTLTNTATSTATATPSPSATAAATVSMTPTQTLTLTASATVEATSTATASPTSTLTHTSVPPTQPPTSTATATPSATPLAVAAAGESGGDAVPAVVEDEPAKGDDGDGGLSLIGIVLGSVLALAVLGYLGVYVLQAANVARYREGFVLAVCPVCENGELYVEDRRYRVLGIPRVRRTVRCDVCRSVLRQVGPQQWRYAVDGAENAELYDAYNGQVLTEDELLDISPEFRDAPLEYIEDDPTDY